MRSTRILIATATLFASIAWEAAALAAAPHPLDPLSEQEIAEAVAIIASQGRTDRSTRAASITLREPSKHQVLQWQDGQPFPRKALAVLRVKGETVEAVVDLGRQSLESWRTVPGAQTAILSAEWAEAQRLVKADPRWQAAMSERGYESYDDVFCESLSAGHFGSEQGAGRRLLRMPCYDVSDAGYNVYARPIEGLVATVDLDAGELVHLLDEGVVPTPQPMANDRRDAGDQDQPVLSERRQASRPTSVEIEGRVVSWHNWSFHLGFDQRFGPRLSLVRFKDGDRQRSVLYQAHVSEVFVPYMEPSPGWSFRTYMDAGEFGLGSLTSSLVPGIDCPQSAEFLAATLVRASGKAYRRDNAVCVFEQDSGAPLWRHSEALNGAYLGRPASELVVRSIPSIAHYDYVIDWVFSPSGAIEIRIGATGIDAVKGVAVNHMSDALAETTTAYGSLVAPGLVAIHHDHYFSLRLDLDVDGPMNRFVRERIEAVTLPEGSARRSLWQLVAEPMTREGSVSAADGPQVWRIENPTTRTGLGHRPSYQIQGQAPTSLLDPNDWPQRRAAFSSRNLWVTTRHDGEFYAAGPYPNQSSGGDGLPRYVDGEAISEADLVAWYTMGFRHVTRPEDWPILSTVWQKVTIRPFGFFDRNPSLDLTH